jgi:hypothetical protein
MKIKTKKFEDIIIKTIDHVAYFEQVKKEFTALVTEQRENGNKDEAVIQEYIERNPIALLGLLPSMPESHNIWGTAVISQPWLKSYSGDRKPDFLIITGNSLELYFNFIEIESPAKKFFQTNKNEISNDYLQAVKQVVEWKTFTEEHYKDFCSTIIKKAFRDQSNLTKEKAWYRNYILVYGDSKEIEDKNDAKFYQTISAFTPNIKWVTYSRLLKQIQLQFPLMTIKYKASTNQYEAIGMMPYPTYGLDEWLNFHLIKGKEELVKSDRFLNDIEKKDLIAQITKLDRKSYDEIWEDDDLTTTTF